MRVKSSSKQFFQKIFPKISLYFLIILSTSIIFFILGYVKSYFQIKTILVEGESFNNQIKGLENLKGSNIFFLTDNQIRVTLVKDNPSIQLDEIVKELPDKLILRLKHIEPIVALKLNQGYALLSNEGKILKKGKTSSNLPVINFYQQFDYFQIVTGNTLDYKEIVTTLFLLKKSQGLNLKVESIDISGLSMIVFNLKDTTSAGQEQKIIFTSERDIRKQSYELETTIRQFKIEAKDFKVLDLRFDKPVVKF